MGAKFGSSPTLTFGARRAPEKINAEKFSTKALPMKVVLFAIWRSKLAYESQNDFLNAT